jgi:hypothetical protein
MRPPAKRSSGLAVEVAGTVAQGRGRRPKPLDFRGRCVDGAVMTTREIGNRISGTKTQLKRHAGGPRETELRRYLASLEAARDDAPLKARLDEIDATWNAIVDALAGKPGVYKIEIAYRNGQSTRRARRGLPPLETVGHELRRRAEKELLELLERRAGDTRADRMLAELAEGERIRAELTERAERRAGIHDEDQIAA